MISFAGMMVQLSSNVVSISYVVRIQSGSNEVDGVIIYTCTGRILFVVMHHQLIVSTYHGSPTPENSAQTSNNLSCAFSSSAASIGFPSRLLGWK